MTRRMVAVDAGEGWYFVYPARRHEAEPVATALLRRGAPRGVDIAIGNEALAAATRADAEAVGAWYGGQLAAWARRGGWGLVNGAPFDRARVREVMRRYPWAAAAPWATVPTDDGTILVMRGPRGQRALVMCGADRVRFECTGKAIGVTA